MHPIEPSTIVGSEAQVGDGVRLSGSLCNRAIVEDFAIMLGNLVHRFDTREGGHIEPSPVVGRKSFVGIGAIVIGNVKIGENATIGANATVIANVPEGITVVGIWGKREKVQLES